MNMKVISFTLFGIDDKYTLGAIENVALAKHIYPGWICYIYYSQDVPEIHIDTLRKFDNCKTIKCDRMQQYDGLFWRFRPFLNDDISVWISRDCDSRLNNREKSAVDEWLASGKCAHIMRDSHNHCYEIMAGMFGINNILFRELCDIKTFQVSCTKYGDVVNADQSYLKDSIWPLIINNHISHDYWHKNKILIDFDTENALYTNTKIRRSFKGIKHWIDNKHIIFPHLYTNASIHAQFTSDCTDPSICLYVGQTINSDGTIYRSDDTEYEYKLRGKYY
jgi:hypothetical protein